jgi:hypothetical protein
VQKLKKSSGAKGLNSCANVSTDSVSVVYCGTEKQNWKIKEINGS